MNLAAHSRTWLIAALTALTSSAIGSTLIFIPQLDNISGTTNYSWFSSANWFVPDESGDLEPAGRVPIQDDNAIITSLADAGATGVRVQNLLLTNNAVVTNGTFSLQNLQMLSGSSFQNATDNILVSLNVAGTNCMLDGSVMDILPFAHATFAPVAPATAATLTLAKGSVFQDFGAVMLAGGSQIIAGSPTNSTLIIEPGAVLSSTDLAYIEGSATNHLIVDNSGLIRVDGGTLRFDNGIDWQCSAGTGEFRAAATNSLILFASPFHADVGTTSLFTGPGTNRWSSGGSIDGAAQVGALDPNTSVFSTGNLEILSSCSGFGGVHVLGSAGQTAVLNWNNGTLSLAAITVDPYGTLLISGGAGTSRQLSGCVLDNSGLCSVLSGDLALAQGASINNLAGGTFELKADGTFSGSPAPAGGAFNNTGTFRKSTSGTTRFGTTIPSQGPDFNNYNPGLVDVVSGELDLMGGISSGEFQTETNAVLWFWGGTHTLNTGASFTGDGSVRLRQGASAPQWVVNGGVSATELELGTNGLVVGTPSTLGNPVTFGTLIVSAGGAISNGTYAVWDTQMQDGSTFIGLTLNVLSNLLVGRTNCVLAGSTLKIASSTSATFAPVSPATAFTLTLAQGSALEDSGSLFLSGGPQIIGGGLPTNSVIIKPGAVLSATNLTSIEGSAANHLIVDNSGLIRMDGGTLGFDNAIDWQCSAGTGEFRAAATNSLILFACGFHADDGTTSLFTGPGTNRWPIGGTIDGAAQVGARDPNTSAFYTGNLEILSSCSGLGGVHVLGDPKQTAVLNWNNGTLSLAVISVDSYGTLLIGGGAGTSRQLFGCELNNEGNIFLHDQATVTCGNGATLNNLAGGTLDFQTDASLTFSNASPMLVLNNAGRFVKSAGTQTSLIAANLNNSGSIEVETGTLQFQGSWSQTAGSTTVDGGAVLGGTLLGIGGGTLAGTGTIEAAVVNGGITSPGGSPGTLSLGPGENYQQNASGMLRIELGGHNPGTQYDQLVVGGNASLAGTMELVLINGFVPQPGDQFRILTCGSQTGQFSQINAPAGSGVVWVAHYSGTNVLAVLANQVKIAQPLLSGGKFSLSFNTTAGLSYVVQESDSLNPSNWQTLEEFAGDGGTKTISDPATKAQRFYRILIQ
jgi:hypothetical protein